MSSLLGVFCFVTAAALATLSTFSELDQVLAAQAKKMAALGDQSSAIAGHISRQTSGGQNPQSTTAASGVDGQASQGGAWTPKEELPYALQRIVDQDTRLRDYIELDHAIMVDAAQEAQEKQELAHRNAEKINRGVSRMVLPSLRVSHAAPQIPPFASFGHEAFAYLTTWSR